MESSENDMLVELQERQEPLTRSEVATYLNLSISTVRRLEGKQLHPTIGDRGVRYFDAAQVLALAGAVARDMENPAPGTEPGRTKRRSPGDLAAEVFDRFEQRQSLSEIVIALRVTPKQVRELYHEWRTGLERGEQARERPAPPRLRRVYHRVGLLEELLAQLPTGESTRISFALRAEDFEHAGEPYMYDAFDEQPGLVADEAVDWASIADRYPPGYYRVTAYSLAECRVRWETHVDIPERVHMEYHPTL